MGDADGDGTPGLVLGTRVPASDEEQPGRAHLISARDDRLRTFVAAETGPGAWFGSVVATMTEEGGARLSVRPSVAERTGSDWNERCRSMGQRSRRMDTPDSRRTPTVA